MEFFGRTIPETNLKIYTDGATSNNGYAGAVGGWAFAAINENDEIVMQLSGHINDATNNICELTAIWNACFNTQVIAGHHTIYSDSAYCINCYKQKWYKKWQSNGWINSQKKPVANRELWEHLIPFFESPMFEFEYVKGHADNKWNNYVDKKAVEAKENING